jgi:hypothetical protein
VLRAARVGLEVPEQGGMGKWRGERKLVGLHQLIPLTDDDHTYGRKQIHERLEC